MATAVDRAEWQRLADEMRAIDTRVAQARLLGADADPWAPPGDDRTAQDGYLDRVAARLRDVAGAVKRARERGEAALASKADEVAGIASSAAARARRIAHDVGSAVERSLSDVEASLERGAAAFGLGIGTVLLVAYLLWRAAKD